MKLRIFGFEEFIDFSKNNINVLEFEDRSFFGKFVRNLNDEVKGKMSEESFVLIQGDDIIPLSQNTILIYDIFNIDFCSKKIISKLYAKIESLFQLEYEIYQIYEMNFQNMIVELENLVFDFPFTLEYESDLNIQNFLKMLQCRISTSHLETPIDYLLYYFDLMEEFPFYKFLTFVNLKSFFSDNELSEIYKYSKYKKIPLLLLETISTRPLIHGEKKIIIDENFDEFIAEL